MIFHSFYHSLIIFDYFKQVLIIDDIFIINKIFETLKKQKLNFLFQKEYDLRKAANKKEVETQKAIEKLAHSLQEAKTMQELKNEEMKIEIVKRTRQIELQDQEILRREKELEATVMKPAEAEKYKLEKIAEAERDRAVLEAEAESEAIRIQVLVHPLCFQKLLCKIFSCELSKIFISNFYMRQFKLN